MSAVAAGFAAFTKPTSVTLIRQDVLPDLPLGEQPEFRIRRFTQAVTLASNPNPDPDKFRLDATTNQSYQLKSTFTRHPVVRGESITDHRIRRPRAFTYQGWITATPYVPWTAGSFGGSPIGNRLEEQVRQLEAMNARGEPVLVVTSMRAMSDMGIESISFDRDSDTGAAVRVAIRLVEIRIVSEIRAKVTPSRELYRLGLGTGLGRSVDTSTSITFQ